MGKNFWASMSFFVVLTLGVSVWAKGSIYDLKLKTISGQEQAMKDYQGKVLLVVNIASQCGFTPQMKDLQALYAANKDRGFVVMAFPSNDFRQEPLVGNKLASQAKDGYGVTFPIFDKGSVRGSDKQPLFEILTQAQSGILGTEIAWNFEKFLINRKGEVINRWNSAISPTSSSIESAVKKALAEK